MSTIAERVATGVAFMDEHDPGWWEADASPAIDLDTLDLGLPDRCILGQRCPMEYRHLAPDFRSPFTAYGIRLGGFIDRDDLSGFGNWAAEHGFDRPDRWTDPESYGALTAEWRRVIGQRREAGESS